MKKIIALSAFAAALFAANTQAASVTYTFLDEPLAAYGAGYTYQTTNWTELLQLPKFNLAGKTLDSAVLTYGGGFQSNGEIDSEDATTTDVIVTTGVSLRFRANGADGSTNLGIADKNLSLSSDLFDGSLDPDSDGTPDFLGGDAASGLATSAESFPNVANIVLLNNVKGAGNFFVQNRALSSLSILGTANLSSNITTQARGQIAVTYTYHDTTVPEPAALALMGLGFAGFAAARKRRQA